MKQKQQNIIRLIELLSDGDFHSGAAIGTILGVSRTAVSQYVSGVQELGLDVFRVTGRGYRLVEPIQLLDEAKIISHLSDYGPPNIQLQRVVSSSNDVVRELSSEQKIAGYTVLAEAQTAGRGRRGKQWQSPFGCNLYLSMHWPLSKGMQAAMGLSLVIGTVLAEALQDAGILGVQVKWPNDVLIDGCKIAGILVELEGQASGDANAIIGVGVNLAMPSWLSNQIDQPWTDLRSALEGSFDRNWWAAELIRRFRTALAEFDQFGLTPFINRWLHFDLLALQPVNILMGNQVLEGVAEGIDTQGALLVRRNGILETFHAGEVSLRHAKKIIN
jgi:BirA family biotin operon repressor/biotin-[acetyl-CoA-carboxylase] ligase